MVYQNVLQVKSEEFFKIWLNGVQTNFWFEKSNYFESFCTFNAQNSGGEFILIKMQEGTQYKHEDSGVKKEESTVSSERLPELYEMELARYRTQIEKACTEQKTEFTKFLSQKRCNQTKIVCKLLKHLLRLTKVSSPSTDQSIYDHVQVQLSSMTQINDIRALLGDDNNTWFRNTLKIYLLSPTVLIPIIASISKKDYVKYLLLYSFDVLHMMVDDPYRNYSTWMVSRQVAKGDYSELVEILQNGQSIPYKFLKEYVNKVFEMKGKELVVGRKCSDTNNTSYFIVTFFIKFLKSSMKGIQSLMVKKEQSINLSEFPAIQVFDRSIKMLQRKKSFYSIKQIVSGNNRIFRQFINKNYIENNRFLLVVLTYERISSLTVKNIIEKYDELMTMFQD